MITTIIFDLWDTLGKKNASFSLALRKHFDIPLTEDFMKRYEKSMQLEIWDTREDMAKAFLQAFDKEETQENISFVLKAQDEVMHLAMPFENIHRIVMKLKEQYTLALLTNTNNFEAKIIAKWGFEDLFHKEIYSFDIGLLKPYLETFLSACELLEVKPEECLFIDDSEENCAGAKKAGMQTIVFEDVAQIELALRKLLKKE